MKIAVCIKETVDSQSEIRLLPGGSLDLSNASYVLNPYDEYAVEAAIQLKEEFGGEVIVVTAAGRNPGKAIHTCLAMGADDAFAIVDPLLENGDPHLVAQVLAGFLSQREFDIVLCGREAIDDGLSQIPPRLAAMLNLPQATIISALEVEGQTVRVRRDFEGGSEEIALPLPCLLSTQKGLNVPRYPPFRQIVMAKKRKVQQVSLADLGITAADCQPTLETREVLIPPPRQAGRVLDQPLEQCVTELFRVLSERGYSWQ